MTSHRFHVLSCPPLLTFACALVMSASFGVTSAFCLYRFVVQSSRETLHCEEQRHDAIVRVRDLQAKANEIGLLFVEEQRKKRCNAARVAIGGE